MEQAKRRYNPNSAPDDLVIAPLLEGAIILVVGLIGLATRNPVLFSSLGATAFEQIEKSRSHSARLYNVVIGHLVGIGCGFAAVAMLHVWHDPAVLSSHDLTAGRVWACVIAVVLTVFGNQLLHAVQPAACSTAVLVALGSFSNLHDLWIMIGGILIIGAVGEPLRQIRLRTTPADSLH